MSIRRLMIKGELAEEADIAAEMLGFKNLEHYVMYLLEQDMDRIRQTMDIITWALQNSDEETLEIMFEDIFNKGDKDV